ncbi:MAG: c-type cytochrome [Methylococcaceae bacterium]|nr:c-type cytochrome [Methylococcaceae bacterium]
MKQRILHYWFAVGLMAAVPVHGAFAAGSAEEGKAKFYACGGCHAVAGYSNAFPTYPVPRIGGQHADASIAALDDYKSGNRKHGSMEGNANGLSEQDAEDIAAYVSSQRNGSSGGPVSGSASSGKTKAETCAACHGADGNSPAGNVPVLAGQLQGYLVKALKDYKTGKRNNPIMNGMAAPLSEQDIIDVAAHYASQAKGLVTISD